MFTKQIRVTPIPECLIDDITPDLMNKKWEMVDAGKTEHPCSLEDGVYIRKFVDTDSINEWIEFLLTLVDENGVHFTSRENIEVQDI